MEQSQEQDRSDPAPPDSSPIPPPKPSPARQPRLGMEFLHRLPLTMTAAFTMGAIMGASHGSTKAAFKFRAENAHRFPTTSTAWYQYHKSKNYKAMLGGLKEGLKMGSKLSAGAMAFCLCEETIDHARNELDFASTLTAGLSVSGLYSILARHDVYTAARTVKLSLKMSLAYGLLQDALLTMKGEAPRYINFLLRRKSPKPVREGDAVA